MAFSLPNQGIRQSGAGERSISSSRKNTTTTVTVSFLVAATTEELILERLDRIAAILEEHTRLLLEIREGVSKLQARMNEVRTGVNEIGAGVPAPSRPAYIPPEGPAVGSTAGLVLLHLYRHEGEAFDSEASYDLTAAGTGRAVGITAPSAFSWLNALVAAGYVVRRFRLIRGLVRGPGQRRRYLTFTVTDLGRSWASRQAVRARCTVHGESCPEGLAVGP